MEERNRVQVKIYGQEFTISGELPRDHIIKVADHVDRSMHDLAKSLPSCPVSSLAVLAAVNCADEFYRSIDNFNELKSKNQQLEKDAQHYVQLWDEAKKNFLQYKEDAQSAVENREELQQAYNEKMAECRELVIKIKELEQSIEGLKSRNESLNGRIAAREEEKISSSAIIKELEDKCRDMESSFFDLQMENIQLKGELDHIKKSLNK
ncbi:MAG TPA: cell division protein ZapA [Bacillota bacterium]|jgi:cell division protein ZapA|nr:cell division protein ZapA [Bacillota bacterium]